MLKKVRTEKIRIFVNGIGRIGRAIIRRALRDERIEIVGVNDLNPDIGNIFYTLCFDSIYGRLEPTPQLNGNVISFGDAEVSIFQYADPQKIPIEEHGIDVFIDATGVAANIAFDRSILEQGRTKSILVTHSPEEGVDFTMVLGGNHKQFNPAKHRLVASSICDATAIAPVLKIIDKEFSIETASITTLHPWLNYQNLMDGPSSSWSVPGTIHHHYALGRSAVGNLIPKPTSAMDAVCKVLDPPYRDSIASFSYRTPTEIVGSADITLFLKQKIVKQNIVDTIEDSIKTQEFDILNLSYEPLVSVDYVNSPYSAVVDGRWLDVKGGKMLKMVLWYDNEAGYAQRVVDQAVYMTKLLA